jgi:hypothetical protein
MYIINLKKTMWIIIVFEITNEYSFLLVSLTL